MKKILLLLALLFMSSLGFSQGSTASAIPTVLNQYGQPLGGALVLICTTNPGIGTCPGLVPTFTDNTLSTSCTGTNVLLNNLQFPSVGTGCSNPGHADNIGNVIPFAATGFYWCQYSGSGLVTYSQPCIFPSLLSGIITGIGTNSPITGGPITNGFGTISCPTCVASTTSPQDGDILRWSSAANTWVPVNYAQPIIGIYAVSQLSTLQTFGVFGSGTISVTNNNSSNINPTATSQAGSSYGETGGNASLNTVIGGNFGENGSTSTIGMQAFYRWSFKAALGGLTNARYWFGLGCHTSGGTGNNGMAIVGTTAYASDTPNKSTEGFLYSAGQANGDFQAITVTAGGSQTNVDTHVVADSGIHIFEMTTNSTGTSIVYWIDGINVATISTNLPPPSNNTNSWGDLFFTGDNKNTASAISLTFYSMQISLK